MSEHLREQWRRIAVSAPPVLYHYTSMMHLQAIVESGHLRLTDSNISMTGRGPGVVWLTTTETEEGNGLYGKGQVRIVVRTAGLPIFHWPTWSFEQGIEPVWYDALASSSGGDPEAWWVCTQEIPVYRDTPIEVMQGGRWTSIMDVTAARRTAARMDSSLIREILSQKPWRDDRTADVMAGKIRGLEVDPNISPGLAGHAYNADRIVLSPGWATDSALGRFLLLTHEFGHSVPVQDVLSHPKFDEAFERLSGLAMVENPWGLQNRLEEVVADGYSEICLLGERGRYEDPEYRPAKALAIIAEVARNAGMPVGKVEQ